MAQDPLSSTNDESLVIRTLQIFRRRKILVITAFAAVMASAVSFALYLPDLYRATAILVIERPVQESFVRPAVTGEVESRLHVIKQEILSRVRLTDLVTRFNLYPELRAHEPMDGVLDQMRRDIEIELTGPEQVSGRKTITSFKLSYTGDKQETVSDVTNALASFYASQNVHMRSQEAAQTSEFLKAQLEATKKQLDLHEHRMREYTSSHPGELPQQVEVNLAALERLNTTLRLNGERQLKIMEDREKLGVGMTMTVDAGTGERVAVPSAPTDDRLEQKKRDLQMLEGQFTSRHPDVVRLKTEIAALEREHQDALVREAAAQQAAAQAQASAKSAALPTIETPGADAAGTAPTARLRSIATMGEELDKLKTDEAGLRASIASVERRLEGVPEREQEFGRITRDYTAAKDLYDSLLKRFDEAQLSSSMESDKQGEQFRILEGAIPPTSPAAPNRMRLLIVGLMLAIAAGVGAALMAEQFDPSFHSVEDLRAFTKIPVLAAIPLIAPGPGRRIVKVALATASVIAVIALVAVMSAHAARGNEQIVWMLTRGA